MLSDGWSTPECPLCEHKRKSEADSKARATASMLESRRRDAERSARRARSAIPPRFAEKRFDSFRRHTGGAIEPARAAEAYADDYPTVRRDGRCLILCGAPGTGKTHLACAILNRVFDQHGAEVRYMSFAAAVRSVKETYSPAATLTEQQAINALVAPDMLVLDEVGVQFGTEAEKIIGFEIINARYEALKPTIVVSNLAIANLETCLGERVLDRLRENGGEYLAFKGESYRGEPVADHEP